MKFRVLHEALVAVLGSVFPAWLLDSISQIEKLNMLKRTDHELDELERFAAAIITAARSELLHRHGERVKKWDSSGPFVHKIPRYCGGGFEVYPDGVLDHYYVLFNVERGTKRYISEPYQVTNHGIKALAKLIDEGWDVEIDGRMGTYFPGDTITVCMTERVKMGKPKKVASVTP